MMMWFSVPGIIIKIKINNTMKNTKITKIILASILLIVGFGIGFMAGKTSSVNKGVDRFGSRDAGMGNRNMRMGNGGAMSGGNMIMGQITSKDTNSITVKMRDESSKIVLFSSSTIVSKISSTTVDMLIVGNSVMIQGQQNPDGSISAKNIDIRPVRNQ